jgi:hypothetical protein
MNTEVRTAQEDLAFLRSLIDRDGGTGAAWAQGYFSAGLIYGAQMLMHAGQALGLLPGSGAVALTIGIGPTLVFLPTLMWIGWRHRADRPPATAGRAVGVGFGAVGAANIALIVVIGWAALRQHSLSTWLIYPACVFILQGAAWMVAWAMLRKPWLGLVAGGWFAFALAMGFTTERVGLYVLFCGLGIWSCMALPGWLMMRAGAKPG